MSVRGNGLWPRAFASIFVALAATVTAVHIYFGQPQAPGHSIAKLCAGTPLSDPYEELPETVKPAPAPVVIRVRLDRTMSIERYLITAGLSFHEAHQWAKRFREESGTSLLRKGHWFSVYKDPQNGDLWGIKYDLDDHVEILERSLGAGVLRVHRKPIDYLTRTVKIAFQVLGDFRQAASRHDVPAPIVGTLERAFSGRSNLDRMPRGSAVKIIYTEKVSSDGLHRVPGNIEAAEIESNGRKAMAFALYGRNGAVHLYDSRGQALGPQFLRYPLHFQFISSGFSYHRWHPILHCYRPHVGVDFAASRGTPVKAIADGRIITAGWCGELGNCVRIQHRGNLVSIYGHLSRLNPDARVGRYVSIGQVIGYVGSTGLSTGPHLHFGLEKEGHYVNPLTQALGVSNELPSRMRAAFDRIKRRYELALAELPDPAHGSGKPLEKHEAAVRVAGKSRLRTYRVSLRGRRRLHRYSRIHRYHHYHHYRHHRVRVIHTVENRIGAGRKL
jgi:murein DD-endopeptidase MepM/ murein hydrolase activator NlpD